ncbi:MAG: prepilin-type N-terminal cleavage/methylation domain-containing protein [Planctomycetota bacterium]
MRGLTLVELLVVVFILALLAQAAVYAGEGALESAQRETTVSSLQQLEIALLGQPGRVDSQGRPHVGGFVADLGSLPVHAQGGAEQVLRELWERPVGAPAPRALPAFALAQAPGDPEVQLGCGWRGPYMRLGFGAAALRDGFGQPFTTRDVAGQATTIGAPIAAIVSLGADQLDGGTGFAADLPIVVQRTAAPLQAPRHLGTVPVQVQTSPSGGAVLVVRVYGPRDGALATLQQVVLTPFAAGSTVTINLVDVPIGPRIVRAYQVAQAPATPDTPLAAVAKSRVQPVAVEPFASPIVELLVQP